MSGIVIVGVQWGDEGKGKITNGLSSGADMVVRFQGGANAGHTISLNGEPFVFHLLPSGISVPGVRCVIGPGVVVDPESLVREIDMVSEHGVSVGENFMIDFGAHMVMPYHKAQEAAEEKARGEEAIGTTLRGIGPTYSDRHAREGLQIGLFADFGEFSARYRSVAERKNALLTKLYGAEPVSVDEALDRMRPLAERLEPYLADTPGMIRETLNDDGKVIFEGAQGTLLDIAFGTYPFVTSSFTTSAGVSPGTGVPPSMIGTVVGIAKAYVTRVGEGPFPTESRDERGDEIRRCGHEMGATTGRPRRCGWLDGVALRYAVELNGVDRLIITKLDVLDSFETIPVCTAYRIGGEATRTFPRTVAELAAVEPVYEELPGWGTSTRDVRRPEDLPEAATAYIRRVEELAGVPVAAVSVGAAAHAVVDFERLL
ncbi:MAG: adenylosuccinate synthase [Candidatus Eisenbacteria bacterium]|nr:adenylosuccinate synthase [Candidatus Eisenbacteria bacterium]